MNALVKAYSPDVDAVWCKGLLEDCRHLERCFGSTSGYNQRKHERLVKRLEARKFAKILARAIQSAPVLVKFW